MKEVVCNVIKNDILWNGLFTMFGAFIGAFLAGRISTKLVEKQLQYDRLSKDREEILKQEKTHMVISGNINAFILLTMQFVKEIKEARSGKKVNNMLGTLEDNFKEYLRINPFEIASSTYFAGIKTAEEVMHTIITYFMLISTHFEEDDDLLVEVRISNIEKAISELKELQKALTDDNKELSKRLGNINKELNKILN